MSTAPVVGLVLLVVNHCNMHLHTSLAKQRSGGAGGGTHLFSYVKPSVAMTGSSMTSRVKMLSAKQNLRASIQHTSAALDAEMASRTNAQSNPPTLAKRTPEQLRRFIAVSYRLAHSRRPYDGHLVVRTRCLKAKSGDVFGEETCNLSGGSAGLHARKCHLGQRDATVARGHLRQCHEPKCDCERKQCP